MSGNSHFKDLAAPSLRLNLCWRFNLGKGRFLLMFEMTFLPFLYGLTFKAGTVLYEKHWCLSVLHLWIKMIQFVHGKEARSKEKSQYQGGDSF
jgi:hypothetical protein